MKKFSSYIKANLPTKSKHLAEIINGGYILEDGSVIDNLADYIQLTKSHLLSIYSMLVNTYKFDIHLDQYIIMIEDEYFKQFQKKVKK